MVHDPTSATSRHEQQLDEAVARLGRLPVLSATVRRVKLIAESEDAGIGDMVAALEADRASPPTSSGTRTRQPAGGRCAPAASGPR